MHDSWCNLQIWSFEYYKFWLIRFCTDNKMIGTSSTVYFEVICISRQSKWLPNLWSNPRITWESRVICLHYSFRMLFIFESKIVQLICGISNLWHFLELFFTTPAVTHHQINMFRIRITFSSPMTSNCLLAKRWR